MINLPFFSNKKNKIKPCVLVILDGWGLAPASEGNAITLAKTPNYDNYLKTYPHGSLIASGESVGLPANEVGNSEVGHLTLGAGRVLLQSLKKIDVAIEKGHFYDNSALIRASAHVKENGSKIHLMGLIGSGRVHSSLDHLYALVQLCKKEELDRVYLHLFTDGRDSPPKQGIEIIEKIEEYLKERGVGEIASIMGRYYAMDRDRRWDRTEKAYKALVLSQAIQVKSASEAVQSAYARGQTDEFIEPTLVANRNGPIASIDDNDAVIFYNFRIDRPKQLTMAFVLPDFEDLKFFDFGHDPKTEKKLDEAEVGTTFVREKIPKNLFFMTMTRYQKDLPVSAIAYGPEEVLNPLAAVLSENGRKQIHMSESEKGRLVTYYFDGFREEFVAGEEKLIVPSPKVETYDKKPEMSLPRLVKVFKKQLKKNVYHFFVINFANPDMVAHSGDIKATIKACEYTDKYLGDLVESVLKRDGTILVTADHGNAEELLTFPTSTYFYTTAKGSVNTEHSNNPVPLIIISNSFKGQPIQFPQGALGDVAPTILNLMGIQKPVEMTGRDLLEGIV